MNREGGAIGIRRYRGSGVRDLGLALSRADGTGCRQRRGLGFTFHVPAGRGGSVQSVLVSDIEKSFTELATSEDEFTIWFRGQVKDVTGVDLGAPSESPPPDVLVDWTS